MEAGKLIELSLGQEPGEFRLNVDGMSITIHLTNPKREEAARGATGSKTTTPSPVAPEAPSASCEADPRDRQQLCDELEYFRQISQEIYEGLGKLSKDINLSIQDLSLAEIIQTSMGSPGEHLDQARNQVTDVLLMTEQATLNIMDLVEHIREDCQTVQSKLLDLMTSQPSEDVEEVTSLSITDIGPQDLWEQVLSLAEGMDHLCGAGKSPESPPSNGIPSFSLADILQILLEFCANEKVKQPLKAVRRMLFTPLT